MTTTRIAATLVVALALAVGISFPAAAHKVVAGAYASGDRIEGEIGFSDGSMAKDATVEVLAEDGTKLGETKTGEDGTFVFTPTKRVVHIFRADLGGGHVADIRLDVADLPASLSATGDAAASAPVAAAPEPAKATAAAVAAAPAGITDLQKAALAEAVRNEVKPLRREIIALKEKNDMQSVLGGMGYIAGLFGLWFFFAGRQRAKRPVG